MAVAGQTSLPWRLSPSVTDSVGPAGAEFARPVRIRPGFRPAGRGLARLIWPGVRDGVAVLLLVALAAVARAAAALLVCRLGRRLPWLARLTAGVPARADWADGRWTAGGAQCADGW